MGWILKVEKPAPAGDGTVAEFVGSGIADEQEAHDHVRLQSTSAVQVSTVSKITDAELQEYGVPLGRTQVIPYSGSLSDLRASERKTNAEAFLGEWVADNAEPTDSDEVSTARSLASRCIAEAINRGIDLDELSAAAGGDLENFMTQALS
jgi:hypothetical protein